METMLFDSGIREKFPGLSVGIVTVEGIENLERSESLREFGKEIEERTRGFLTAEEIKEDFIFHAYRDFFWRIGIDPTKIRPASEALTRRILLGRSLPQINTAVDAYNLASVESKIPIAAFDSKELSGELTMRFAHEGESFFGIGMKDEMRLSGGEVVIADEKRLVAVYPYRDDDLTKVTLETINVILISCGVPGIEKEKLIEAARLAGVYVRRFCGGSASTIEVFP
jgi:DNA/RNA-binding domain of Phe-tRNA-synthetase-like protein